MTPASSDPRPRNRLRWWPAALVVLAAAALVVWMSRRTDWSFQERTLRSLAVSLGAGLLLFLWWVVFSRAPWRLRLTVALLVTAGVGLAASVIRIRGVSGDVMPILEFRWRLRSDALPRTPKAVATQPPGANILDFPQFLGPDRTGILDGPALVSDWAAAPPSILWRQPIGAGWSGWAIAGRRALTQEQRGEQECSTCYDALSGELLWSHPEPAHYHTTIAGEGPRCTPTVVSNRVFTLGATGILICLELETGKRRWSRNIVEDAHSVVPSWGFAGSPLVRDGKVIVSAGGQEGRSLLAYRAENGELAWSGGDRQASYSSPFLTTLAGTRQILAFNSGQITAHDPESGRVLWEYPWGIGQPHVAVPVVVGSNRVLFSSGYGVGSELLEITIGNQAQLGSQRIWRSRKLKAKFSNLVQREGFLYGLDDGVLTCLDLKDGSPRWKEGHYGHGQALLVRDLLLLMGENGELVLLRPTPEGANPLHHFRVFNAKTWNPIALAGELLFVRNDQEAACLRLAVN